MKSRTRLVNRFESFVMCREFVLDGLAVVCFDENRSMFIDAYVIGVEFSEAAYVIDDSIGRQNLSVRRLEKW